MVHGNDYSNLGAYIGENTQLTKLVVYACGLESIPFPSREFAGGLKRNPSIIGLELHLTAANIVGGTGHEILNAYQENNGI